MQKFLGSHVVPSLLIFFAAAAVAHGQNAKPVVWKPIIGHQKELVIFMPDGFATVVDDRPKNFGTRSGPAAAVEKTITAARMINGTLLLMTYYDTKGDTLYENLSRSNRLSRVSETTSGGFKVKRFAGKLKGRQVNTHYFVGKSGLYEAKSYSRDENDPIAEAFLASVRIAAGDSYLAPNADGSDAATPLPRIQEVAPEREADSTRFDESMVDRGAIVLFQPAMRVSAEGNQMPPTGSVKVTALLTASGKVTDVKTSGSAPWEMKNAFAETVKNILFIPAEKDGKLVSVQRTFSFEMTVEVRGSYPRPLQ